MTFRLGTVMYPTRRQNHHTYVCFEQFNIKTNDPIATVGPGETRSHEIEERRQ